MLILLIKCTHTSKLKNESTSSCAYTKSGMLLESMLNVIKCMAKAIEMDEIWKKCKCVTWANNIPWYHFKKKSHTDVWRKVKFYELDIWLPIALIILKNERDNWLDCLILVLGILNVVFSPLLDLHSMQTLISWNNTSGWFTGSQIERNNKIQKKKFCDRWSIMKLKWYYQR